PGRHVPAPRRPRRRGPPPRRRSRHRERAVGHVPRIPSPPPSPATRARGRSSAAASTVSPLPPAGEGQGEGLPSSRHLESFIEMLRAERTAAGNTVGAYERRLTDLSAFLARRRTDLASADAEMLRAYLAALDRAGMAPRTAARRLSAIRQFYRFLVGEGLRPDDP